MVPEKSLSLGAAMIVKDAGKNIEYTLKSLLPVCRQIVVVDTGSTDSTPVNCTRLGADVHFFRWTNNFSDARNYSLQFLRSDWIIIIDDDEILDYYTLLQNADLFNREQTGGIRVKIENHLGQDELSPKSTHKYTRIFRNNPNFSFTGRIHEQIAPSIEDAGYDIVDSDIIIRHYGYMTADEEKLNRNIELLNAELSDNPQDAWIIYHLAETKFAAGLTGEAKKLFESVDNSPDLSLDQMEAVFLRLAQIALRNDNFDEVDRRLDFISRNPDREGFRQFLLAASFMVRKTFREAYRYYSSPQVGTSLLVDKQQVAHALELLKQILQLA